MRELVRRAGQRFMVGFEGKTASADVKHLIRDFGVGHVVLFRRNVDQPEQVADLVRELQSVAKDAGHDVPLLVAADQEGGRVACLGEPWTVWPAMRAVGRVGSEETARRLGRALAHELSACGIRCDFAPVLDVDTNPKNIIGDRCFGDDPDVVARLGAALIEGLQKGGVAACAKHFLGHGDTELDSSEVLPTVDLSRSRLEDVELRPFRKAVEAEVAMVMTAHVVLRELDDQLPATLSPRIVDGLLRKELKYGGVIVAEDLEMKAVARSWEPGPAAVLAAKAGCDLISLCERPDAQVAAIEGFIRAVESEEISWTSLEVAGERVRRLKERFVLPHRDPDPKGARRAAGLGEHRALAEEIFGRSRDRGLTGRVPRALGTGDRLAICAPAGPVDAERLERGVAELRSLGFEVLVPDGILERRAFTAGGIERRLAELHGLLVDDAVHGIVCARGGAGAGWLLPRLDPEVLRAHPKPFVGYSDITFLHLLFGRLGMVTLHGPMAAWELANGRYDRASLLHGLTGAGAPYASAPDDLEPLRTGRGEGVLRGGCLSILAAACGTPWALETAGEDTILFLEDVDERPYRIDRMLLQLGAAGAFAGVRGIVFGEMRGCAPKIREDYRLEDVLLEALAGLEAPVALGLSSGHANSPAVTLPLGVRARLTCGEGARFEVLEPAVA